MSDQTTTEQKKVPLALTVLAAFAVAAIILAMLYVGSRLETIEDQLRFQPTQSASEQSASIPAISMGRSVYVPAYSHIYSQGGRAFLLEVTLSVRNTDPEYPIRIDRVRYYDTQGRQIREFIEAPITIGPLQTATYLVEKKDAEGGSGANFIVEWSAREAVNPPIIEAVMVGIGTTHNLSFTSRGEPIGRTAP